MVLNPTDEVRIKRRTRGRPRIHEVEDEVIILVGPYKRRYLKGKTGIIDFVCSPNDAPRRNYIYRVRFEDGSWQYFPSFHLRKRTREEP